MKQFLFLWFWAVVYVICDLMQYSLWLSRVSQFFFPVLLIIVLPLWSTGITELNKSETVEQSSPSLPRVLLIIGVSIFLIWYFSLSFSIALTLILIIASLFGFMSAWILLLISLLILWMMPIVSIIDKRNLLESLSLYSYYGLAWGFVANIFAPWITKMLKKIPWIEYAPQEWKHYISELEWIFRGYLKNFSYIFPLWLMYIFLEKTTWPLYLSQDIPIFLILFMYGSFLIVPFKLKDRDPFTITF